ncbi:hypothetical protein DBR47_13230 [Paucibacter sp. KBW04]|uniref:type IV pilus modification PilV family protein n=1 Tax=Paucibacter sp. KBW04 TaxID=2153361 RepID=UPI000F57A3B4|nr:type II secretion system protein [Paucibacter sp. KBW04]RQO58647.1 hypothetical protein DBR47_13230 [Paucibacter sp. KBW04]
MALKRYPKKFTLHSAQGQAGIALTEALISMVLLGIVGLGLVYALGRGLVAQKFQKAQSLAVQVIRADLQAQGVANGCPVAGNAVVNRPNLNLGNGVGLDGMTKTCRIAPVNINLGGVVREIQMTQVSYRVPAQTLLGPGTLLLSN